MCGGAVLKRLPGRLPIVAAELAEPVPAWSVSEARAEEALALAERTGGRNESSCPKLVHLGAPGVFRPGIHLSPESGERHKRTALLLRRMINIAAGERREPPPKAAPAAAIACCADLRSLRIVHSAGAGSSKLLHGCLKAKTFDQALEDPIIASGNGIRIAR